MSTTPVPSEFCCPICGAEYFECETNAYGICVGSVGDRLLDAAMDEMNESLYGPLDAA
jgi:hypothetical protein